MGTLNIVFRTQSAALIAAMTNFFRLWVQIEDRCLAPLLGSSIACALYDGRFVRPLAMPRGKSLTADDVAGAISAYVQLFDRLLKGLSRHVRSRRATWKWPTAAICEAERCSSNQRYCKNTNLR